MNLRPHWRIRSIEAQPSWHPVLGNLGEVGKPALWMDASPTVPATRSRGPRASRGERLDPNVVFAPELRIIPLLHGRIKRVHVDVNDLASGHLANHLSPAFGPSANAP